MKLKAFFLISILANLVLVGAFFVNKVTVNMDASPEESSAAAKAAAAKRQSASEAQVAAFGEAKILPETWSRIYSKDLPTLIANLRAAGVPPRMIRTLVAMELYEQYSEKRRALRGDDVDRPIWQLRNPIMDPEKMRQFQALYREQNEMLKKLLGNEPLGSTPESSAYLRRTYGNISSEKIEAIQRMNNDFNEMRNQVHQEAQGIMLPEDREKLAILEKEKRADLEATLSPEELADYDMRNSPTMGRMRGMFGNFDITEQEFTGIYAAMKQFDDKYNARNPDGSLASTTSVSASERRAAQEQLQEQLKQTMGEQRYQEYQRSNDPVMRVAGQLATRLQLPKENVTAVYDLKQSIEREANAIRANKEMSKEGKAAALKNLSNSANAQIDQLLTPRGGEALKKTIGGSWLRSIERSQPTRTTISNGDYFPGF